MLLSLDQCFSDPAFYCYLGIDGPLSLLNGKHCEAGMASDTPLYPTPMPGTLQETVSSVPLCADTDRRQTYLIP